MLLYRTPNLVIDRFEFHATVNLRAGRVSRRFYFRPLTGPLRNWTPIANWKGHPPTPRELRVKFGPFKLHMLQAERSVVENARGCAT